MNGFLLIDKEKDFTSHDVVACVRGGTKMRRVGHTGTLDPMATGLLVVLVGRATRALPFLENDDKQYEAVLKLGVTTDTQDLTGNILRTAENIPDEDEVKRAILSFSGDILQIPPMYSAVKVRGQKLYKLARRGIEIEREPRPASIRFLEISRVLPDEYLLKINCSKGTYVRTLIHDIGEKLGCGAAMGDLRRTACGRFSLDGAVKITDFKKMDREQIEEKLLQSTDVLFSQYEKIVVSAGDERKLKNGMYIMLKNILPGKLYRVYGQSGEFLMVGEGAQEKGENILTCVKSFFEVS